MGAAGNEASVATANLVGDNVCRIDMNLSRVTVSDTADVPFHWDGQGCLNGQTQMVRDGEGWTLVIVPETEASISIRRFDPTTGTYRSDKYLVGADVAEQGRTIRATMKTAGCTGDPQRIAEVAKVQGPDRGTAAAPAQRAADLSLHAGRGRTGGEGRAVAADERGVGAIALRSIPRIRGDPVAAIVRCESCRSARWIPAFAGVTG